LLTWRSPCRGQSCVDALPDQVALELGQRPKAVEDELATVGGSVILLGQPPIADPPLSGNQDNFDQKLISGPLLDRIDIHLDVPRIPHEQRSDRRPGEPIQERIEWA
jgi:hypothetical protein